MNLQEKSTKRILVVDDEKPIIELLARRLQNWGYEVLTAVDGENGLRLAETQHPDLLLLDIRLPEMSGREVCAQLRARRDLPRIPVIFLTALGMPEQVEQGFQVGADDYIVKPFKADELRERLESCFKRFP